MFATKTGSQLSNVSKPLVSQENTRVIFLDNLKIALVSLVVANHAGQAYVSINTGWPVVEGNIPAINNWILGTFFSVNDAFFMALFFLISAYFLPASFDRKGWPTYLKDRLIRLGIPIIIFLFIIFPLFGFLTSGDGMSFGEFLARSYFNFTDGLFTFGHMWFLGMLLIFAFAYAGYRIVKSSPAKEKVKLKVPGNVAILLFAVLLTVLLFVFRLVSPPGNWILFHLVEPARLPAYAAMFLVGIIAYRNDWMRSIPVATGKVWGLITIATLLTTPFVILVLGNGHDLWAEGFTVASFSTSAWDAFLCVGLCVSLPILFREKFNTRGKILTGMAGAAFLVYLIHPIVLLILQVAIFNVEIHPFVKFILVAIAGIALSFGVSYLIRKIPYVDKVV